MICSHFFFLCKLSLLYNAQLIFDRYPNIFIKVYKYIFGTLYINGMYCHFNARTSTGFIYLSNFNILLNSSSLTNLVFLFSNDIMKQIFWDFFFVSTIDVLNKAFKAKHSTSSLTTQWIKNNDVLCNSVFLTRHRCKIIY